MDKKFTFHKIFNGVEYGWFCLIGNDEAYWDAIDTLHRQSIEIFKKIKQSDPNVIGHAGSREASQIKILLGMEMEKNGDSEMPAQTAMDFIMQIKTSALMNIYSMDKKVYVNRDGGVRPSTKLGTNERISDVCYSDYFVFPDVDERHIEIQRWPMGRHYYLLENKEMISVDGLDKWNTYEAAEKAKNKYINSHVKN